MKSLRSWHGGRRPPPAGREATWNDFQSKPRPCLRPGDLGKKWGWGLNADQEGVGASTPSTLWNASSCAQASRLTVGRPGTSR
ncbi:DUF6157 family protein [Lapillicoccus sp.]|uniref:DUF6157 family protein n=1 Tax=Lapillicoccus sp. TaxID=1909287 RepID=UPI003983D46C